MGDKVTSSARLLSKVLGLEKRAGRAPAGWSDAYHGTHDTFESFDPSTQDFGTHVGSRPTAANTRLKPPGEEAFSEGANVLPLKVRLGNSVRINDLGEWDYQDVINELERAGALKKSDADLLHDRYVESGGEYDDEALRKHLRKNGVDSLVYRNEYEYGGDSYIMLDPKDIRSRFAAFDPAKADSADLLAGAVPATVGAGLTIEQLRAYLAQQGGGDINDLLGRYAEGGRVGLAKLLTKPIREAFEDWKWRSEKDVNAELGLTEIPPHVEDFGRFMREQQERAQAGDMTARDLLKAYGITVSSMGRGAVSADVLARRGHPTTQTGLVRPEGAMGDWMMAPAGQAYLDAAENGIVDRDAIENLRQVSHSFGKQNMLADQLTNAATFMPERAPTAIDAIARGDVDSWRGFTNDLPGVDSAKSGFLGAPLGFGKLPTADAREVKLHTGLSTKDAQKFMGRKGWADATVDRIADRQTRMGLRLDPSLEDFRQHLTHHTVWDKVADEKTTHADLMRAMRLAGAVPAAALGAAAYGDEAQAAGLTLDDIRAYLAQQDGGE